MEVAKKHQDQLERIKKNVKNSYEGFMPNYDRFNEFRKFIFETSLSQDDITMLTDVSKPQIEFNVTEAYISRLMGEFSKQEPSVSVYTEDENLVDPLTAHVTEQHIRHILLDSKNHNTRWELMKDLYSGGFSVAKIWTEYANAMSMKQVIQYDRVFDPTLCGFDLLARQSHKGDGEFCFEIYPYELEVFKSMREFKHINTNKISFARKFAGFNWSYLSGNQKIVLVADYYEKKKRDVKIVETADGKVMTLAEYNAMQEAWKDITVMPSIKGKPRWTTLETICRYRCVESEIISYTETDFTYFPLVFFDGNSIMIKSPKTNSAVQQFTRPYPYHAKGAQRLKNFTGITLANEIENMVQHKFMVAREALPKEEDWLEAYKDVQKANTLVYNAFFEEDPDKPIPNPVREIQRVQTPPEVVQTFAATDSLMQNILGSYDASLGINNNQLSGIAIVEAATQSNAAAMPYVVGFLQGMQRIAEIFVDLIPKYYKTPRTIPVMGVDGKHEYVKINTPDGVGMFYDTNALNVRVEAGVSFQIQKSRALQQIIALQQSSPLFAQFMNERGLGVLLDNVEIKGIDQLKMLVEDWMKEQQKMKQAALQNQQQQMQNNPLMIRNQIEMAKLQQKAQESQQKAAISQGQLQIDMERLKNDQVKVLADSIASKQQSMTQMLKAETERFSKQVELAMKKMDMSHRHSKDAHEFLHKVTSNNMRSMTQ